MKSDIEVRDGQIYQDTDPRMNARRLTVAEVALQKKTEGRFKARYTYATCTVGTRVVRIDTDRLRSSAYRLVFNPCPEGVTQDACPTPTAAA